MTRKFCTLVPAIALLAVAISPQAQAHKLVEKDTAVMVAKSDVSVAPRRDWNRLDGSVGKNTERWTLDGPQLNQITFFAGIAPGSPLFKERNKKREPLPKFSSDTLLIEVPELLETTYRPFKNLSAFQTLKTEPTKFLGNDGVAFEYEFRDSDGLVRNGAAKAAIIRGKLYMIVFDAPRLHFFLNALGDFAQIANSATIS